MLDFSGKNVIVTGGSRGIGAASVKLFAKLGANVAFNYRKNYRKAEQLAEECAAFGTTIFFEECDVSDYQDVTRFVAKAIDRLGDIHVLVNNAGIWDYGAIDTMPVDVWRRTMQVNLDSVYYFSHLIVKHMKERGIKGNIVNISSTAGQRGEAFHSHYAATKGAIISFTKSLAAELGPLGIRVNSVAPGWVNTDMSTESLEKEGDQILAGIPLGFIPEAEDIAGPIVFMASDMARAITGEILNVNAGNVLCG
ncbi:MAG TPA: SDR family oxidoreductase [Caldithrix abyssi]|uniref:SDR family oxidoreductase n=1 Tax=Caldithrix abyssi TaxID=187145 RepID=A0A7V5PPV6_CALAY|nr:SDR family oxidoreductase [Caldithrix abyssi]